MRRVAAEELRAAVKNLARPAKGRDDGVHEARKSLKKVRALLRLVGPAMGGRWREEVRSLRDSARRISGLRDAAVAVETLDALVARNPGAADRGIASFRTTLLAGKQAADLEDVLSGVRAEITAAANRVAQWQADEEGVAALRPGLERAYRRGRRALKAARGRFAGEFGHRLRMRVKDLWYGVRLLDGVWLRSGELGQQLKELEDALGEDHNLAMLMERLPVAARRPRWVAKLAGWIEAWRAELCARAEAISDDIFREKTREFVARVMVASGPV